MKRPAATESPPDSSLAPVYALAGTLGRHPERSANARLQALDLEERVLDEMPEECLFLAWGDPGLELREGSRRHQRGVAVHLGHDSPRRKPTRSQPLARAIGPGQRHVLDATAGFGEDAFLLASLGHRVTAAERSPIMLALLADGLERAAAAPSRREIVERIRLVAGNAETWLATLSPPPEVVYIDPMFPPKRKTSALPPRPIQVLKRLVGDDPDITELVEAARACGAERVVVKRPLHAPIVARAPTASHEGKLVRYDVYRRAPDPAAP